MICLSVMAFSPFGEPFCNREKTKYCSTQLEKVPKSELQYFNLAAPDNGTLFILLSMFIAFGYVLAASASDAMVVEYAQREPEAIRGRIQTAIYTVRTLTGILAYLVTAFALNAWATCSTASASLRSCPSRRTGRGSNLSTIHSVAS
ncbi:hypothetical protein DYB26_008205 [Aphanomyces astaci]|uniref:Uncharacterized protein n=2 Tax=Aphanomyces astaci TaxID=112090 RepID=A0A397FJP7_APHAT|nr:hypothetical protein DYB26_008205 [Aphanomyces astaci]RHZ33241.1 hypothetical protein DYB31_007323 [Aphanomyces astaci]